MPRIANGSSSGVEASASRNVSIRSLRRSTRSPGASSLSKEASRSSHQSQSQSSTAALRGYHAGVSLDQATEVAPLGHDVGKLQVVVAPWRQEVVGSEPVGGEQIRLRAHFALRDAAVQVGAHVLGLGGRGVVGVAADVEVVVVLAQLLAGHDAGVAGDVLERGEGARRSSRCARARGSSGRGPRGTRRPR